MPTITGQATSSAPPERVWALLEDVAQWPRWGSWKESSVEGGVPHGPGAVRVLRQPPFRVRERVTEWVPGERMGYELLEGMNVKGYRSTVVLSPTAEGGTTVRWTSEYERAGFVTALLLRLAVRDSPKRLAKAAAASAGGARG
jgi:uncharacterized protein YndB with AHSA1/START domain